MGQDQCLGMSPHHFAALKADFLAALGMRRTALYVQHLFGGSQPEHRVGAGHHRIRLAQPVHPHPAGAPDGSRTRRRSSTEYTIIDLPSFRADPARHGTRSETVVAVNLTEKLILIGGTAYAGEMKKSVFGILNYLLPAKGVMPMHCSANIGPDGETAVFFGLSGTGKTTLSADASRTLDRR